MLLSLLKHYFDTDTALKLTQSVYCFTTSTSHVVENYFPRLWGTGISDAIFVISTTKKGKTEYNNNTTNNTSQPVVGNVSRLFT